MKRFGFFSVSAGIGALLLLVAQRAWEHWGATAPPPAPDGRVASGAAAPPAPKASVGLANEAPKVSKSPGPVAEIAPRLASEASPSEVSPSRVPAPSTPALQELAPLPAASPLGDGQPRAAIESLQGSSPPPGAAGVLVLGSGRRQPVSAGAPPAKVNPLVGASKEEFVDSFKAGEEAFHLGQETRGVELFRLIFDAARDRADLDVSPVAIKLLEHCDKGIEGEPCTEYHRYLARSEFAPRETRYLSGLRAAEAFAAKKDAASVQGAWESLTQAYLAAGSAAERRRAIDLLEPFLKQNLFSRRLSPILEKHSVRDGESLSGIAQKYQTTVGALKRINAHPADIIRSGQRLLVLPGQAAVFIKKREFRLWLLIDGRLLFDRSVGLGESNSTPEGEFVVSERQKDPIWYRQGEAPIPPGDPRNVLGTRWLGFKDTEEHQGYGIHGTPDEGSIGKETSSGCIRLRNADIELLFDFVPLGTVVAIEP